MRIDFFRARPVTMIILLGACLLSFKVEAGPDLSDFADPPVEYRPWARWWWPGDDIEDDELEREVRLLADHGFGGVEIEAVTMGLDAKADREEMERRRGVDSPSFYSHLATVMEAAKEAGLGVDLNLGSGWPSGGAHIGPDQGLVTLLWSEQVARGPRKARIKLRGPDKPIAYIIFDLAGRVLGTPVAKYHGDQAEIVHVVAGRIVGGKRTWSPLDFHDQVELDPDSIVVLTDRVVDGRLTWDVPDGRWLIVNIYRAPEGEFPTLAAQDPPGYVVDHFDKDAALSHLKRLLGERTGLTPYHGKPLRAFFNDSFEFKAERLFTDDFMDEFQKRRGYDLAPHLPAVLIPGADNFFLEFAGHKRAEYKISEFDERVQYDYSLTISDLFIERYLDTTREWGDAHGVMSRAQCYGMDIDIIRAMGRVHVPETEQLYAGGSEMFLKMASSGACLHNKPVVTSESMVWASREYMTTPIKIKAAADKLFTSGINSIIYHGYSYHKDDPEYGDAGWYPWSSPFVPMAGFGSNLSEANPYWKHMKDLNRYIARCQYLLRQGKPEYDLIVYYPFLGIPSSFSGAGEHDEFLFNGRMPGEPNTGAGFVDEISSSLFDEPEVDPRIEWLQELWPFLQGLEDKGFTWIWINDESLATAEARGSKIAIKGNEFAGLVIADAPWIAAEAAENVAGLARQGASVMVVGDPPEIQPGLHNHEEGDLAVARAMRSIIAKPGAEAVPYARFIDGGGVRMIRRRLPDGARVIFFRNPSAVEARFEFVLERGGGSGLAWLDPWTGEYLGRAGGPRVSGALGPYQSLVLARGPGGRWWKQDYYARPESWEVVSHPLGPWTLEVEGKDFKGGGYEKELDELNDWREVKELRYCSSEGFYTAELFIGKVSGGAFFELDLGEVGGAAEVRINGKELPFQVGPVYSGRAADYLVSGENIIEVTVTPTLRNRLIGKANRRDRQNKQFKGKDDTLLPAGLIGPARLILYRPATD